MWLKEKQQCSSLWRSPMHTTWLWEMDVGGYRSKLRCGKMFPRQAHTHTHKCTDKIPSLLNSSSPGEENSQLTAETHTHSHTHCVWCWTSEERLLCEEYTLPNQKVQLSWTFHLKLQVTLNLTSPSAWRKKMHEENTLSWFSIVAVPTGRRRRSTEVLESS